MPHQLRYAYNQGDTLIYDIYVTHEVQEPECESLQTLMALRSTTVVEVAEPNRFVCRVNTEVLDTEGLAALAPTVDTSGTVRYSHDARGQLLLIPGQPSALQTNMVFPEAALEPGQGWNYVDEGPDRQPTTFNVVLDDVVEQDGDHVAILSSEAKLNIGDPDARATLSSSFHFSLALGRRLWSRTLIENIWTSGRKMTSIIEVHHDPTAEAVPV